MGDSINSNDFSAKGYLLLIQKHFVTHMHSLAIFVEEGLSFAQLLSLETLRIPVDMFSADINSILCLLILAFFYCVVFDIIPYLT